jgi:hypothetical protein
VLIPAGAIHYPTLTYPAVVNSITIESGASFIGAEYLTVGNAIVKRNFPAPDYHYLSSPVLSTTFGSVFPINQSSIWAYRYDEPSGNWLNQTLTSVMTPATGFSVQMSEPQTAIFTGQLNSSSTLSNLIFLNTSGDPDRAGWNLLGNPFQSAIMWDSVYKSGVGAIYVWDGTGYLTYNAGIGSLTGGLVPSCNGFFVKAQNMNAQVGIPLKARKHSNIPFYKQQVTNLLVMKASNDAYIDKTFIHFNEDATVGFDDQFDAYKLDNTELAPMIYCISGSKDLSINVLPMTGNEDVDLGFKCGVEGNYELSAEGMESFDPSIPIFLEDLKEAHIQDLRSYPEYSFNYNPSDKANRFKLHFKSIPVQASNIEITSALKTVIIRNYTGKEASVLIYDLIGKLIKQDVISAGPETKISVNVPMGAYLVKVINSGGIKCKKVVLR